MKNNLLKIMLLTAFFLVSISVCSQNAVAADIATILFLKGKVEVKPVKTDKWVEAYKGMSLSTSDTIRTGYRSWAEIAFDKELKNIVKIDENTEFTLSQISPMRLNLMVGNIYLLVEKLDKGSTFEVRTPTAVCGIRGSGLGTKTDAKKTVTSAYEGDAFAKGIRKDGSVIEDNIIIKEGFKTVVEKFKKPSKLKRLSARERRDWKSWREDMQGRLSGAVGAGKPGRLRKIDSTSERFQKVIDTKENIIEKQDTDKIEKRLEKPYEEQTEP